MRVLRSPAMNPFLRAAGAALLCVTALAARSPAEVLDAGRLVVFQGDIPVGTERFQYEAVGDSIVVTSKVSRRVRSQDGTEKPYTKDMMLVTNKFDFGLVRYVSNEDFEDDVHVRGILPGDTVMTYYEEQQEGGTADRLVQPPGRLFVLDPLMFTLFDVICRNLHGKTFDHRPVQLITLAASGASTPVADVQRGGLDTLRWGGRRTIARRYTLNDSSGEFIAWANSQGQMIRLEHASGLHVERDAPALVPLRKRTGR